MPEIRVTVFDGPLDLSASSCCTAEATVEAEAGIIIIIIIITRLLQTSGLGALQQPLNCSPPAFSVLVLTPPMACESNGVQVIPNTVISGFDRPAPSPWPFYNLKQQLFWQPVFLHPCHRYTCRRLGPFFDAQIFLGVAFAAEGLLFGFHLKGTPLDWSLHVLLVMLIFAASLVCFGEYRCV